MKPIVHYLGEPEFYRAGDGNVARVHALDHPILGQDIVRTSRVLKKLPDGFETLNTIYKEQKA